MPSNNFSLIYEGSFAVASDGSGWLGLAIGPNTTARVFVDNKQLLDINGNLTGNFLGNIPSLSFSQVNATLPPPGSAPFEFTAGQKHSIRIEYQTLNLAKKFENVNSVNSLIQLFWNIVDKNDPVGLATKASEDADIIVFVGGGAWNSDGEGGDRATLGLSPNQSKFSGV